MTTLNFYFDYSSPYAYLASTQVERIAAAHDATLVLKPFLLGGLFNLIGQAIVPLNEFGPAKQAHARKDWGRWADFYGVPMKMPSRFPMMTVNALRMTSQLEGEERIKLMHAIFGAYWADDRDINDKAELVAIADGVGVAGWQASGRLRRPRHQGPAERRHASL